MGSYQNEPISNYREGSVFSKLGMSVGRLDVLSDRGISTCTAFIVSDRHIITNHHCTDLSYLTGATRIDAIQFVAGYTKTGVEEITSKYTVIPTPVETSKKLDYAVMEVIGDPSKQYGELKLASLTPQDGDPFWIIGHPKGEGQRISREKCRASSPAVSAGKLRHTCDTLPGNSGSPVIDAGLQQVVALHHMGSKKDSVNYAIPMSEILKNSAVLAAYKAPDEVPKANAAEPKVAAVSACEALYAEAKEAKACYAYNAYVQSCSGHSLAPIAKGYINKFCKPQETTKVAKAPDKTCDDDPSLCSTDQLCGQSLTFKSGKAAWRNGNISYVAEAKRRGLSCGVTEVVAKPKKTCRTDVSTCSDAKLCTMSVTSRTVYGQKVWNTKYYFKYVTEAKRRGLSCGVTEVVLKPEKACSQDPSSCKSDADLCIFATTAQSGTFERSWATSSFYSSHFVEAKRRGLTCGVNATKSIKTAFSNTSLLKRKQLQYALKKLNYYKSSVDAIYGPRTEKALTGFAKDNGLDIGNPASVFKSVLSRVDVPKVFVSSRPKKDCYENVSDCTKIQLCERSVYNHNRGKAWIIGGKHVTEAKRRGLNCGVY
ncbi:trypsin-like peptidase domain-containing protein [Paracoccaceae bacterium]|nr:trypsin-like peptidase domain-containing protein [Paracoccaceae bacterium]